MTPEIVVTQLGTDEDRQAILAGLQAHSAAQVGPSRWCPAAILLQSDGVTVGGMWGHTSYGWMFVEYLVVPDALRGTGVGTRLMATAEAIARDRGCTGIWLDTFSFQARGFYEKLGFSVFGAIPDYPAGHQRFFLTKRL